MSEKRIFILAHAQARQRALECICAAPTGWRVTVEPPRRNGDINAALHAKIGEIAAMVPYFGALRSIESWKRLFVAAWLRATGESVELLPALDGAGVDVVFRRTSDMTQAQVRDLLLYIEAWESEHAPEESAKA